MNVGRRDLLKYFAAGTIIAPAAGASPMARLIEPPKVEIVEAIPTGEPLDLKQVKSVSVAFHLDDGSTRRIESVYFYQGFYAPPLPATMLGVRMNFSEDEGKSPAIQKQIAWAEFSGMLL